MPYSVETVAVLAGVVVAGTLGATGIWIQWYGEWKRDRLNDLERSQITRDRYITSQFPIIQEKLGEVVASANEMTTAQTARLSVPLLDKLDNFGDLVREIESVRNSRNGIAQSLRRIRDGVTILIIVNGSILTAGVVLGGLYGDAAGSVSALLLAILLLLGFLFNVVMLANRISLAYNSYKNSNAFLTKKNLYEVEDSPRVMSLGVDQKKD